MYVWNFICLHTSVHVVNKAGYIIRFASTFTTLKVKVCERWWVPVVKYCVTTFIPIVGRLEFWLCLFQTGWMHQEHVVWHQFVVVNSFSKILSLSSTVALKSKHACWKHETGEGFQRWVINTCIYNCIYLYLYMHLIYLCIYIYFIHR